MRKLMKLIISMILLFVMFIIAAVTMIIVSVTNISKDDVKNDVVHLLYGSNVEKYRDTVEDYAKTYHVEDHIDTLLAMMMQESAGRGSDPMQSSESLCGEIGCIDDPEASIEQGVKYFAKTLEAANGSLETAIQSYNFGIGFAYYVNEQTDGFNQDVVIKFSQEMYEKASDKSIYSCLRKEAEQYDACYGDIYYVRDVLEHKAKLMKN